MTFICGAGNAAPDEALRVMVALKDCCLGALEDGPGGCTCWEAVYDLDQAPVDRLSMPGTRAEMCADCAYRPGSPESQGDDRYVGKPTAPGVVFWCHTGMRKPLRYRHPAGITVEVTGDFYKPPIRDVDGVAIPYKADGTAGERCAGWAAHQRTRS